MPAPHRLESKVKGMSSPAENNSDSLHLLVPGRGRIQGVSRACVRELLGKCVSAWVKG